MKTDSFRWADLLRFRKMLAPRLILLLYWAGNVALLLSAIGRIWTAFSLVGDGLTGLAWTLVGAALLFLCWRVVCELAILAFAIYERLGALLDTRAAEDVSRSA